MSDAVVGGNHSLVGRLKLWAWTKGGRRDGRRNCKTETAVRPDGYRRRRRPKATQPQARITSNTHSELVDDKSIWILNRSCPGPPLQGHGLILSGSKISRFIVCSLWKHSNCTFVYVQKHPHPSTQYAIRTSWNPTGGRQVPQPCRLVHRSAERHFARRVHVHGILDIGKQQNKAKSVYAEWGCLGDTQ